jgi:hypothetical protein
MKKKKHMTFVLYILGTIALLIIVPKIILFIKFKNEVRVLFSQSKDISDKTLHYSDLDSLPEPVQGYFKHVFKEGQAYISYVRLKHNGQFKPALDKDWVNITGEQYFTTQKPGFIWKGSSALFTARDMYLTDKGRLVVSLFSFIKVVDGKGEQYDQGELLRWLSESVWFPTNLLPGENLQWLPIDKYSAKIIFNYNGLSLFYFVTFNDKHEITKLETKRYMNEMKLETWICKMGNYKNLNGILIPTTAEALWKLDKGEFSYARFNVLKVEYNNPKSY